MSKLTEHQKLNERLDVTTKKDFSGTHGTGSSFSLPVLNEIESKNASASSIIEMQAEVNRMHGASGIFSVRQYAQDTAFTPTERVFDTGFGAITMHNHPNYRSMPGSAEFSAMINGYYIRSRHNDYRAFSPVQGNYLARKEILPPDLPASVKTMAIGSGVGSATPFAANTQYKYMRDIYTATPGDIVYFLSYIECWWEEFKNNDVGDHTDSFRHAIDATNMRQELEKALYFNAGGHKNRKENIPYEPIMVRRVLADGSNQLATFRYRINVFPVANRGTTTVSKTFNYSDASNITLSLPPLPYVESNAMDRIKNTLNSFLLRKDLRQRWRNNKTETTVRSWLNIIQSRLASFDLPPATLQSICESVPGMMGPGVNLTESYTDYGLTDTLTDFGTSTIRNAAYYNKAYSFLNHDAAGRSNAHRGFNDPNLFVAKTTNPRVIDGFSYMIPYELVSYSPRNIWNPDAVPDVGYAASHAVTFPSGIDAANAMPGMHIDNYNFMLPSDLIATLSTQIDPADTRYSAWINSTGVAKKYYASGVNIFDYDGPRRRFAIQPNYHDYSKAASDISLIKKELKLLLKGIVAGTVVASDIDKAF